ncbi:MAG: hypothetical protein OJJ54_11615 [Pseudonocardia sp.]|nr:hypothetical protein [Pseudonocardia sp.]
MTIRVAPAHRTHHALDAGDTAADDGGYPRTPDLGRAGAARR